MKRLLLAVVLLVLPSLAAAQSHPVFFNDATSLARYAAMKANYDANPTNPSGVGGQIYKYVKARAAGAYNDPGLSAAEIYHWSGDAAYAQAAYTQSSYFLGRPTSCDNAGLGGNYIREFGWQNVLVYDQAYTGWTTDQRNTFLTKLNQLANCVNSSGRRADSDQTVGEWATIAMLFKSTGDYNSTVTTYWNDASRLIGGYDAASATLGDTRRNAIRFYVENMSGGGAFLESTEYSLNTIKLLILPNAALKSAGSTVLPEVDTWIPDAALSFIHEVTPGIASAPSLSPYQRQDNQADWMLDYYRTETCFALAGVAKGTSAGPYIQDFCLAYLARSTLDNYLTYTRGFLVFDPDATRGDHTTLDRFRYNDGAGLWLTRTGWTASDSMFGTFMSKNATIDHVPLQWGEFQLWRNGRWAIRHPIGYGGQPFDSRGSNGLSVEGLDVTNSTGAVVGYKQYRTIQAHRNDFTNGFHYETGTIGGSAYASGTYNPPQTSLHEFTRSFVYLSNWDVVVVYDRVNSDNFVTNANTGTALATWINSRPRTEVYVHSPVSPTLATGTISWEYATGESVKVHTLWPTDSTRTIQDESTLWPTQIGPGSVAAAQKKFDTVISPSSTIKWNRFLNVWDAHGSSAEATVSLVQDATHAVDATLITKGSLSVLAAFNAIQGADVPGLRMSGGFGYWQAGVDTILNVVRLRTSDYSLTWTSAVATKALLFDLDPNTSWTYTVNAGASTPLTVDSNGIGVIDIATTGEVTLAVIGGGALNPPTQIDTSSVPDCTVGVAYSQALSASLGDGGPYTWTVASGALPGGLSLSSGGTISGTPSAATDSSLTKTASTLWGNGGAYSTNALAAGDGYVETTAAETNTYRMIGLSNGNTDTNYTDIDYGLDLLGTGSVRVYEGGTLKYSGATTYAAGDVLRVAVVSGSVVYKKNGTTFYTSLTAPSYPLNVDTALYDLGSTLKNVVGDFGAGAVPVTWGANSGVIAASGGSSATFTAQACDGSGTPSCATRSFTMSILNSPVITTASLSNGVIGTAYSETLAVAGGTAPYTWSVADGSLCTGLNLAAATGVISAVGGPTSVQTCTFTIRVTDSAGSPLHGDKAFSISVTAVLPVLSVSATPVGTSVVIRYGIASLDAADSCTCSLMSGETVQGTFTNATGAARRTCYFTNLTQGSTYGVDVLCGTAQSARSYFTVPLQGNVGGMVSWKYSATPTASLLARSVTKLRVSYAIPGDSASTVSAACASGCTVTLPLTSGLVYELSHEWLTAADAVIASSATYPVAVP